MVAAAGLHHRDGQHRNGSARHRRQPALPPVVPLFVVGFVAMVALRSTGWLSAGWLDAAAGLQDMLLGAALFGLGSAVRIRHAAAHRACRARLLAAPWLAWLLIAAARAWAPPLHHD